MAASRRKPILIITLSIIISILSITSLVLWSRGYFTFQDPCVRLKSLKIDDFDLTRPSEEKDRAIITDLFDNISSFGENFLDNLPSISLPSEVSMTIRLVLEVNNTNTYDINLAEQEQGVVTIPAEENNYAIEEDWVVGSLIIPSSTLKGKTRNDIPILLKTTIDVSKSVQLARLLMSTVTSKNPIYFRIAATIQGYSWIPSIIVTTGFNCLASSSSETNPTCTQSVKVGVGGGTTRNLVDKNNNNDNNSEEMNSACYV